MIRRVPLNFSLFGKRLKIPDQQKCYHCRPDLYQYRICARSHKALNPQQLLDFLEKAFYEPAVSVKSCNLVTFQLKIQYSMQFDAPFFVLVGCPWKGIE